MMSMFMEVMASLSASSMAFAHKYGEMERYMVSSRNERAAVVSY